MIYCLTSKPTPTSKLQTTCLFIKKKQQKNKQQQLKAVEKSSRVSSSLHMCYKL